MSEEVLSTAANAAAPGSDRPAGPEPPTPDPRCDYVPRPGNPQHRCPHPAVVRVLYDHGAGEHPQYRERCLLHAAEHLGPRVGATWDTLRREWVGRR